MILSGVEVANAIQQKIRQEIETSSAKPGLAVLLVGDNPASLAYIRMKRKACEHVGIQFTLHTFPTSITEKELLTFIDQLNRDKQIHGILVQMPLPNTISPNRVMLAVDPEKDVDGFHPLNMGNLLLGNEGGFVPCTPLGILALLQHYGFSPAGKHVVIVGRSNIVGKPLAALLMQKAPHLNATVTLAHSQTEDLPKLTRSADILVAAMGKPRFITGDMVKEGAVVIDVGISRIENSLVGDVDFESVSPKCIGITPVPKGVGPMTVAMLLQNTWTSCVKKS